MYKVSISKLNKLFSAIAENVKLYLPVEKESGKAFFTQYNENAVYASHILNTVKSAKDFFFPQVENIAEFKINGTSFEVNEAELISEDFAIFGVRSCDLKSFTLLDKVFLSEPADPYYTARRKHCTVITAACSLPEATCFCTAFGINPAEPEGDVATWNDGKNLYCLPKTEKGQTLTEKISSVFDECGEDENSTASIKENIEKIIQKLPFGKLNLSYWKNTDEKEIFANEIWQKIYKGCLGCGTCTFVCPTCQCYDIRDYDSGKGIRRFRCWDSCMYSDFTKMAHGNPRKTQMERFRQRFMHKLKYFPENNGGEFSCVGCGRCLRSCPQSLNIVKVARSVDKK